MTANRPLGLPLIRMGAVTSTMDIARRLESLGASEGITVIAASQTHGRGRSNRTWQSPPGSGLYCSILLRPNLSPGRFRPFSIAAGLAICEALDPKHDIGLKLKWPNDILYQGRKLAGILITTNLSGPRLSSAIAGIGLNLLPDPSRPETAISLAETELAEVVFSDILLANILNSISNRYSVICANNDSAIDDWPHRLAHHGQAVTIQDGKATHIGTFRGLDLSGALILDTPQGPKFISSGELTRGPRPLGR